MIISSCQTLSLPEPGSDYVGDVSVTASGRKCQNWLDQTPHKHDFAHLGNHNSCRNLDFGNDEAPLGAWCYTTDSNIRSGISGLRMCTWNLSHEGFMTLTSSI